MMCIDAIDTVQRKRSSMSFSCHCLSSPRIDVSRKQDEKDKKKDKKGKKCVSRKSRIQHKVRHEHLRMFVVNVFVRQDIENIEDSEMMNK